MIVRILKIKDTTKLNAVTKKIGKAYSRLIELSKRNKVPQSKSYPYTLVNLRAQTTEDDPVCNLYAVGSNWKENKTNLKPIAICWGFNDWKLGFTAEYLREYRVIFIPRKIPSYKALKILVYSNLLKNEKISFIAWGYNLPRSAAMYAKTKSIDIIRMEDAFIRSAELGAAHTTPYSLIVDKKGFYYDCYSESELESIISNYDFDSNEKIREAGRALLATMIDNKISKYNFPNEGEISTSARIKTKKRIAVLGQVDSDASIKYGNPNNWTSEELVELAWKENPDAQIFYRPHPEIYRGYQKTSVKARTVKKFAEIVSPDEPLIEFLESVDHVYTITSLSGFEALIRGKIVTVVGAPFYSGWGPTDDRCQISRRKRKLGLLDIFCAAYIIYPRYLSSAEPVTSVDLEATVRKIIVDKELILTSKKYSKNNDFIREVFTTAGVIEYDDKKIASDVIKCIKRKSELFKVIIVLSVINRLCEKSIGDFLFQLRNEFSIEKYNSIVNKIKSIYKIDVTKCEVWMLEKVGDLDEAFFKIQQSNNEYDNSVNNGLKKELFEKSEINLRKFSGSNNVNGIIDCIEDGLLCGTSNYSNLLNIATILSSKFLYKESYEITEFLLSIDPYANNRNAAFINFRLIYTYMYKYLDACAIENSAVRAITLKPDLYDTIVRWSESLVDFKGLKNLPLMLNKVPVLSVSNSNPYITYLMESGKLHEAKNMIEISLNSDDTCPKLWVSYSKLLSCSGRLDEAYEALSRYICNVGGEPIIEREYIRICNILGKDVDSYNLFIKYDSGLDFNYCPTVFIPSLLSIGNLELAYSLYIKSKARELLSEYIPKLVEHHNDLSIGNNVLFLSVYGPGDEIRFSTLYEETIAYYPNATVTCDIRLYSLLSRTYKEINFLPVKRVREISPFNEAEDYNLLPDSSLCVYLDNNVYEKIDSFDQISLVTDLLHKLRRKRGQFAKTRNLVVDEDKLHAISKILPKNKKLVGINWRSSLSGFTRDIHYLNVEQISSLFSIPDTIFVNLQYDDCKEEVGYLNERFPDSFLHLDGIDQYNDFDTVAALIKCLDLVIAPCTSVAELSGALGVNTILFSNSRELDWRRKNSNGNDIWFSSMTHISSDYAGDKSSLVKNLVEHTKLVLSINKDLEVEFN